jgi:hypothetical protein
VCPIHRQVCYLKLRFYCLKLNNTFCLRLGLMMTVAIISITLLANVLEYYI